MISYNNTNYLVAQTSDMAALDLKSKTVQDNKTSDFRAVFDRAVSSGSSARTTERPAIKAEREAPGNTDSQVKFKSYRDLKPVQTNNSGSGEKAAVSEAQTKPAAEAGKEELGKVEGDSLKDDEQINVLAQMLGISPAELVKLSEKLGFSAEDLSSNVKLGQLAEKLGDLLQLDNTQKTALSGLVQEITKQLAKVDNKVADKPQAAADVKAEQVISGSDSIEADFSKLAETVKAKLDELLQAAKAEPQTTAAEVAKVIEAMRAQALNRVSPITQENGTATAGTSAEELAGEGILQQKVAVVDEKADSKYLDKSGEDSKETGASVTDAARDLPAEVKNVSVQVGTNAQQNPQQQFMQALNDFRAIANNQTEAAKSTFAMPQTIKTGELLNQVVEQAKVVIGPDKTEMVIHLKPDHLGKLELKVVTEQGIVAAKFVAENQQVKEIIETNMQQLKDSLQKQGINIEGVSVQVGQEKKEQFQNNSFGSKNGTTGAKRGITSAVPVNTGIRGTIMENLPERLAQYSYETSTINLTA
ncbi:flagellar hook-length control protein FliK [Ruminiclostridium hungatei]|uniref:Flagellar hook-length control protein FliK n=1 Tax=Ruminiclostridium hungatei TaxID=48256 RepID=A0A1V4SMX0_RUMHU|nr:flagellar hook-length control protein FliK [Ruminiclostridium hungatei]OPX44587.1 flagellar hook-length control protein FliK [Ruminiclostridium hungatei]